MNIDIFKKDIDKIIDEYVVSRRINGPLLQTRFRASGIADCPRSLLFTMMNLPQDKYPRARNDSPKGYRLMDHGSAGHRVIQDYFIGMGLLDPKDMEEKKKIIDDEYCFSGRCDGILDFKPGRILLEIKTINQRDFETLTQPKEAHFYQGQAYLHFLNKLYKEKLETILFLYVNRNSDTFATKGFWIDKDQKVIGMILNKLKVLKQYLDKRELYQIPEGFNPEDATFVPCRWCPFNTAQLCKSGLTQMSHFPGANILANKNSVIAEDE